MGLDYFSTVIKRCAATLIASLSLAAMADAPPAYLPFERASENAQFVAKVEVADRRGKTSAWEWKYSIKVFEVVTSAGPLWEADYYFDGYEGGMLSNDGCCFVYVNFWFFDKGPLVYIYKKGSTKTYSAHDLQLSPADLKKTASHKLWLQEGSGFWPAQGKPQKFIVQTVQGERSIDLY
jgi:hypothetical protein